MLVNQFLEQTNKQFPKKIALIHQNRKLTYNEIESLANSLARALIDHGLQKQDRSAIYLENSLESVISIFGVLKASGVFVIINPQTKAKKTKYILSDCQVKTLITDRKHFEELSDVISSCPHLTSVFITGENKNDYPKTFSFSNALKKYNPSCPVNQSIDIDLASLIYTSGSTGRPKGVMLTHLNMVTAAESIIEYLENRSDDIILNCLPLSFDYGLYQILMAFKFGGTVVLERSFLYPYQIIELIIKEKVTGFPLVPTIAAILLQMKNLDRYDFSNLRYITNTAQALPPKYITKLHKLFSHTKIYSMYGLTECKRVSYLPPQELIKRPTSVGKAIPNSEAYIINEKGEKITEPDQIGELIVRGAHIMKGYWNLPEETALMLKPGPNPGETMLYTGDLFKMDSEGYLYFIARKDDIIKTAGEKVSPKEIEDALYELDDVLEAGVIGVPDDILGQAIKAVVALKKTSTLTEKTIIQHCSSHLESFMVPKYVEIRENLPKTTTGKIRKKIYSKIQPEDACGGKIMKFYKDILRIECKNEANRICSFIKEQVIAMKRDGIVIGLSGGIDSALSAMLCVKAIGKEKVVGMILPEKDSNPISVPYAKKQADDVGIDVKIIDITPTLEAFGTYDKRDKIIREIFPEYKNVYKSKITLPADLLSKDAFNFFTLKIDDGKSNVKSTRLNKEDLNGIVAATDTKQRTRMMYLYHYAEMKNYLVCGTTNKSEIIQGFFVKYGDGGVDIEPLAHLYKIQVFQLARYLGVIKEIIDRVPSPDTYSFHLSDEEFYFRMPYDTLDLLLYAWEKHIPLSEICKAMDLNEDQVKRAFRDFTSKYNATKHLRQLPPNLLSQREGVA